MNHAFPSFCCRYISMYSVVLLLFCLSLLTYTLAAQPFVPASSIKFQTDHQLRSPYAGGLNSPQFSEIDLNMDGVMDLFIFDRVGDRVITYLRTEDSYPFYTHAPQYEGLFPRLNDWAMIRDYNADGVPDIVTSDSIPILFGIQFYKGSWDGQQLNWKLVELDQGPFNVVYFEAEDFSMRQLEVLSGDKPAIEDIDGDGDLDILDFDGGGSYVEYFQNMSVERGLSLDQLVFKRTDRCWGKFFEVGTEDAQVLLSSDPDNCYELFNGEDVITTRHTGSSISLYDRDQDQLYDLLVGDIANDHITFLRNTGTPQKAYMTAVEMNFPADDQAINIRTFISTFVLDVNNDGLQDIIAAPNEYLNTENVQVAHLYLDQGTAGHSAPQLMSRDFLTEDMIDLSQGSHPAIVDYNADGLWDILVGVYGRINSEGRNGGQLYLFQNTGTSEQPFFQLVTDDWLGFKDLYGSTNFYLTPDLGDLDGDGDQDLLIGNQSGKLIYFENIAGVGNVMQFKEPVMNYMGIDVGSLANPTIVDIDGDGLKDLVIGESNGNNDPNLPIKCSHLNFYKNIGSTTEPMFESNVNQAPNDPCFGRVNTRDIRSTNKGYASPQFIEQGGDLALLVGTKNGTIRLYKNIRQTLNGAFELHDDFLGRIDVGDRAQPLLWDLDDDGRLELITGNLSGGLMIYHTQMNIDALVATKQIENAPKLTLSPNPANTNIRILSDRQMHFPYEITDISGRIIKKGTINTNQDISIQDLQSTIYFIRFQVYGQRMTLRFIRW